MNWPATTPAREVLALRPGYVDLDVGVAGLHHDGVLEVRLPFDTEPPAAERRTVPVQRTAD